MDEVILIAKENRNVETTDKRFYFDYLIIATGTGHSYFCNAEWEEAALGLKTLVDALIIREKIIYLLKKPKKPGDREIFNFYIHWWQTYRSRISRRYCRNC